jgi:hypothetical protein
LKERVSDSTRHIDPSRVTAIRTSGAVLAGAIGYARKTMASSGASAHGALTSTTTP